MPRRKTRPLRGSRCGTKIRMASCRLKSTRLASKCRKRRTNAVKPNKKQPAGRRTDRSERPAFLRLQVLLIGRDSQFVAAIVLGMATMAGDTSKFQAMFGNQLVELLPELGIGDGLELAFFTPLPAVAFPAGHPFGQALADIFAVGKQLDVTRPRKSREPFNHGLQFHAIVCRVAIRSERLFYFAAAHMAQDERPATGARIAAAGAVGEEQNFRSLRIHAVAHVECLILIMSPSWMT